MLRRNKWSMLMGLLMIAVAVAVVASAPDEKVSSTAVPAKGNTAAEKTKTITWEKDLDAALAKAKKEKKGVMAYFYSPTCGYCTLLENKTFSDPEVISYLEGNFVSVKLNVVDCGDLARKYRIVAFPSLIFLDGNEKELARRTGYLPPKPFLVEIKKVPKL